MYVRYFRSEQEVVKILTILSFLFFDVFLGCVNKMLVTVSQHRKSLT